MFAVIRQSNREVQTQRTQPVLATIQPTLTASGEMVLAAPDMPPLRIILDPKAAGCEHYVALKTGSVQMDMGAFIYGEGVTNWLTEYLSRSWRGIDKFSLIQLDVDHADLARDGPRFLRDQLEGDVAAKQDACAIHDWAPYHIATTASLKDLNDRLAKSIHPRTKRPGKTVGMDRFRPNIVLTNSVPYEEDSWIELHIGSRTFRCLQSCVRCTVPSIDQRSGKRPDRSNPTREMKKYRMFSVAEHGAYAELGPYFGIWAAPDIQEEGDSPSMLQVGAQVRATTNPGPAPSPFLHWRAQNEAGGSRL